MAMVAARSVYPFLKVGGSVNFHVCVDILIGTSHQAHYRLLIFVCPVTPCFLDNVAQRSFRRLLPDRLLGHYRNHGRPRN